MCPAFRLTLLLIALVYGAASATAAAAAQTPPTTGNNAATTTVSQEARAMVLDSTSKDYTAQPGEYSSTFTFQVTNRADTDLVITQVRTSCGCSVAQLPSAPWRLRPGESGSFQIVVDLLGKSGLLHKTATVESNHGTQRIEFRITIPQPDPREEMRLRNLLIAKIDRQAVFRDECAQCHVEPAKGKRGRELYVAACAICHADEHRASMVPDLRAIAPAPSADVWRHIIIHGKPGSLMPAFGEEHAGPLTSAQIDSLVEYLTGAFATEQKPEAAKH